MRNKTKPQTSSHELLSALRQERLNLKESPQNWRQILGSIKAIQSAMFDASDVMLSRLEHHQAHCLKS